MMCSGSAPTEGNNQASDKDVIDGAWDHEAGELSRGIRMKVFNSMMQGLNLWVEEPMKHKQGHGCNSHSSSSCGRGERGIGIVTDLIAKGYSDSQAKP